MNGILAKLLVNQRRLKAMLFGSTVSNIFLVFGN
ncbi:hypothetical protein BVRB_5g108270 [Beta vulgaris subsp. vulgaris]|nr:hypothetical protein BVRB_5g108270 [Beta vulgaris subsp. vulgaris]